MTSKRRTWIILGSILIAAIAIFAWWLMFGQGSSTEDRNVPGGGSGGFNFFPISGTGNPSGFIAPDDEDSAPKGRIPTLRQLSENPVSGAIAYNKQITGGKIAVYFRWIERATGHVFETTEADLTNYRVSNETIPSVIEAVFSGDAKNIIIRYIRPDNETIETALGQIKAKTVATNEGLVYNDSKIETQFLEPNIAQVASSPDGLSFAKLSTSGEVSVMQFTDIKSSRSVFNSPLSQLNLSWPQKEKIHLTTRPAAGVDGYLFAIDSKTGSSEKIIESTQGLVALTNPTGTRAIYSTSDGGDLELHVLNLKTGEDRLLELKSLPDKCVWSKTNEVIVYCGAPDRFYRGEYPTNWYQGLISFTDNLWRINVDTESYDFLFDSSTAPQRFDAYNLSVSPNDEFLLFRNKKDLSLWSLNLQER